MRKSILAVVIAAVSFVSVSANAVEGGDQTQVMRSVIGEVNNALADHNNFSRAVEVVTRRLGYDAGQAEIFVANVRDGKAEQPQTVEYARGQSTATYSEPQSTPVYSGESHRPAMVETAVDNSTHLDSNVSDADRDAAKLQALKASIKDGKDGVNGQDGKNGADGKDGESITGATGAQGDKGDKGESIKGDTGRNGENGKDGKDGVTTVRHELDTQTKGEVIAHGHAINRNSAAIERNSQRIDRNTKQIAANTKAIKKVGAMSQASSNLHYNRAESGYAVAVGEYKGATAIAGGVQFNTSRNTAVTIQASFDGDSVGASVGMHGSW